MTNPIDVIKTKMMVDRSEHGLGMWGTTKQVYRQDRLAGFFQGCQVRAVQISVGSIMFFGLYEAVKRELGIVITDQPDYRSH